MRAKQVTLLFLPAIVLAGFGLFVQILRYEPLIPKKTAVAAPAASIPIFADDAILGDKRAPMTLVAFGDFGCDACRLQMDMWQAIEERFPKKLKIIWKGLSNPTPLSPDDRMEKIAFCANEQRRFPQFVRAFLAGGGDVSNDGIARIETESGIAGKTLSECLASGRADAYLDRNKTLAESLNIQSLPTVFMNNRQIEPPATLDGWITFLNL
jgi:protein-disulfide isomerase